MKEMKRKFTSSILLQMEIALCGGVFVPPTVLEDQNKMNKQKLLTINHKYS